MIKENLTLAVFPSDDIEEYFKKGEVRKNYYNPNNIFSKIYIFNMSEEKVLDKKLMQFMCGKAEYEILFIGEHSILKKAFNIKSVAKNVLPKIRDLNPTFIRTYGMIFNSYIAAYCARHTKIPLIVSLHDNYNGTREIALKTREYANYSFYVYWKHRYEKYILDSAEHIIGMYDYAKLYALDMGMDEKKVSVIYNKVDTDSFKKKDVKKFDTFTVINIMRQTWMKRQEILIKAVAPLKDVNLILIGQGPDHEKLKKLAHDLGCNERVIFIKTVMNKDLPSYYQKSHVFATAVVQRGVGIPVLESLSVGIPVIHAKYVEEKWSDILSEYAYMVDNTPESFRDAILQLKNHKNVYKKYEQLGVEFRKKINFDTMSTKEANVYLKILDNAQKSPKNT